MQGVFYYEKYANIPSSQGQEHLRQNKLYFCWQNSLSPSCQAVGSSGVLKVIQQAMDSWLSAPLIFNCEQIQAQILQNKTRNKKPRFPKHITSEEEY